MSDAVAIPWPLSSAPGASPAESGGRLVNCYGEPLGKKGPAEAVWRRSPGLTAFATAGFTGPRGFILVNNLVFSAQAERLITTTSAGTVTNVGALAGTKRVTFARNNVSPTPDIQCVDPDNGAFTITSGSAPVSFTGGGVLPAPNCCAGQDGYIFWGIGDNRMFAAGPNSITVNSQTFATVQSRPTGALLRLIPYRGLLFAFCTKFCEAWSNTANPSPGFPYSRYKVIDRGLVGRNAIAGSEEGFGSLHWAADDFGVYRFNAALEPEKVSPPDLDRAIKTQALSDAELIEAHCYVHSGHSFWAISSPTWTWELNLGTGQWNERMSFSSGLLTRWRATLSVNAFNKWLVGDHQTGNIISVDDTNYMELTNPLLFRMESAPVRKFPQGIRVARADFDVITGVGNALGSDITYTDPQCGISWSVNGGRSFGNPLLRALGTQAKPRHVYVTGCGVSGAHGHRWRLDISDPVYAAMMGATQSASVRAQ